MLSKYRATYDFEVESGDIPPNAIAEYLLQADKSESLYNIWELSSPRLVNLEVLDA